MLIGEILQDRFGIVADGGEANALLGEPRFGALQLDQLLFAVGSPVGGAEEQQNRAVGPLHGVERL